MRQIRGHGSTGIVAVGILGPRAGHTSDMIRHDGKDCSGQETPP